METSRDDFSLAIRSAFLKKEVKQKFSLIALIVLSIILLYLETLEAKPLNYLRSFIKDTVYRASVITSYPSRGFKEITENISAHLNTYNTNVKLKEENEKLKIQISDPEFLKLENSQLKLLLNQKTESINNLVFSRVIIDKKSPYLNSFIINDGSNKKIKNGMAVLDKKVFIGRIVDVNFFSSRVLLITDLNSKIPVLIEPKGYHAILSGAGNDNPVIEFLPDNHLVEPGDKIYTSGKEGIFSPGIPIGEVQIVNESIFASLFANINQISYVSINTGGLKD